MTLVLGQRPRSQRRRLGHRAGGDEVLDDQDGLGEAHMCPAPEDQLLVGTGADAESGRPRRWRRLGHRGRGRLRRSWPGDAGEVVAPRARRASVIAHGGAQAWQSGAAAGQVGRRRQRLRRARFLQGQNRPWRSQASRAPAFRGGCSGAALQANRWGSAVSQLVLLVLLKVPIAERSEEHTSELQSR